MLNGSPDLSVFGTGKVSLNNPPRPVSPDIIQLELIYFDPVMGEGEWHLYHFPDDVREYTDWAEFERVALAMLATSKHFSNPFKAAYVLDYLHNTKVLDVNLKTGEMYNPFVEELNIRSRNTNRRGHHPPKGTPDGTYES